jgi:succinate dehydrogenase / fumarate reductase cytochrome b subunit
MSALVLYLKSSIGRKWVVALSGLGLAGFVLAHMAGNMLLFLGADAFNAYGHAITSNPLYKMGILSGGLIFLIVVHAAFTIWLTKDNKTARSVGYAKAPNGAKASTWASLTMTYTGTLVLFFIVSHLVGFKYGPHYETTVNGVVMRDLHRVAVEVFSQPGYVFWYLISLVCLGFHLSHGVASAIKTLGLSNPKYLRIAECAGYAYAVVVAAGFISQPIYVYLFHK